MAIIPIYGMTKTTMTDKVEDKLWQVVSISWVDENHLTLDKGKWLVTTRKVCKDQVRTEVDRIFREMTLKIITSEYNNQPGIIKREHMNPTLVSYGVTLQSETGQGPTIQKVETPRQLEIQCVVLYGSNNAFPNIRENKRQNRSSSVTKLATEEQET